jgi:biopolymer transport protein ExbD
MHAIGDLNVIPLIDLAFALLIIFMISTPLINKDEQTIPVELPISSDASQQISSDRFVSIVIVTGGYQVDGTSLTVQELDQRLHGYTLSPSPPVFSIRADRNIPYQEVVTVFDLLARHNLTKISLDTRAQR